MSKGMISFSQCPECERSFGTRGMARHRKAAHGVEPATKGRKPQPKRPSRTPEQIAETIRRLQEQDALALAQMSDEERQQAERDALAVQASAR